MKRIDVLRRLSRSDKWFLGGANRLLWAPPFPSYLDSPGFWDEAHYYNLELKPLFTWTLLDEDGSEIPLKFTGRTWNPSELRQTYQARLNGTKTTIKVVERKSMLPNDIAVSVISLEHKTSRPVRLHLVAWTVQEHAPSKNTSWLDDVAYRKGALFFKHSLRPSVSPRLEVACGLGISPAAHSHSINLSERTAVQPHWKLTPWAESFRRGRLPGDMKLAGADAEGLVYFALQRELVLRAGKSISVTIAFGASPAHEETQNNLAAALRQRDPIVLSRTSWNDHFDSVPAFECSDQYLTNYYWYRWYGLKLNTQIGTEGNYKRPFVCEGIGYFRAPISYSAQCHMLENRWMRDPGLARGSLSTFIDNQREDGGFRGYIDVNHYRQEMFYHANWGNALLQLDLNHPSSDYLESVYEGLAKYAAYFDRERDEEVSGLYDIDNHYETGQEYMHRYVAVDPRADQDHWGDVFRLKGVDVTVYIYELKRALAAVADRIGKTDSAELWRMEAERIRTAVREKMWDSAQEMFFDVDPKTGKRTMVKAASCFYPYFTDIVDNSHRRGLTRHLLNPKEFWTPFPVPSSSLDDEFFSPLPEWKGKRMNCPWNGRVWPMTNSHIAEALAASALAFSDTRLRLRTAEFILKYVRMMFFRGNPELPNCFEHYNPVTGEPSRYRGIDDYQHSWVNDLLIKYVGGIRPEEFLVVVDPFPFNLEHLVLDNVIIRGRRLKVRIDGKRFTVWLDGKHHTESELGQPVSIQI
ncbi:MAG TPA: hypothetical protein DEP53_09765 [Bacteroidetes bacterium]|nr:hypothetical protein [Bacteroidota bacterium]